MGRYIPTEKELKTKVDLVEIEVEGEYLARIDEKRRTSKRYSVKVKVPKKFTLSDVKRLTPKTLDKKHDDFMYMRTFEVSGKPKDIKEKVELQELYSARDLSRFKKARLEDKKADKAEKAGRGDLEKGIPGDTSDYDPDTGLPPVVNDGPEDGGEGE